MGPKRKGNKSARGGKGSGKVASRVAQFEAASAGANNSPTPSPPPKPENGVIANGDGTLDPDVKSNSSRRSSAGSGFKDAAELDPTAEKDAASDHKITASDNLKEQELDEAEKVADENGDAAANGEFPSATPNLPDPAEKPVQEPLQDEPAPEAQDAEQPEPVVEPQSEMESGNLVEPTLEVLADEPAARPESFELRDKTPSVANVPAAFGDEKFAFESPDAGRPEPPSDTTDAPNLDPSDAPKLGPSPLPDVGVDIDECGEFEIVQTQPITRVGGRPGKPMLVKPVLVTAGSDDFRANVDPNTYFSDPNDTVIVQAAQSPATSQAQRVRVLGGSRSPSTKSTAHVVSIGPTPPLPTKVVVHGEAPKTVAVPPTGSLSDDAEILGVAVVGFHHTRGPEVEYWVGPDGDQSHLWPYLPFQSLPDGSHSFEESVCYFTLLYDRRMHRGPNPTPERDEEGHIIDSSDFNDVTTLFAVSCSRQVATADLENAPEDATRSSIHKSIVVIARKPVFGSIKEKLTVVTRSYFEQGQFDDRQIIDRFYENLVHLFSLPQSDSDFQVGINVRDFIYRFGPEVMVIFKALLMEKRILFFGQDTDLLCTFQFALISLIPNLLNHLEDCGSPLLSSYETNLVKPTFMQSSNRESMLKFMGFPLHVFAAGGIFNPFVPLQQLDELTRKETQYGLFGSTNQLFLTAAQADVVVNIDQSTVEICNADLKPALALSSADRSFIQPIAQAVVKSWDGDNKWQPRSLGFVGSDDYIRQQFEDYLLGLLASVKYETYLQRLGPEPPKIFTRDFAPNPLKAFNLVWAAQWKLTNNYRIFNKFTDDELFDIVEPAHVATIKNRARIDAISEPTRSPPVKEDKFKGFFSGLFKRAPPSEKSVVVAEDVSETTASPAPSTPALQTDASPEHTPEAETRPETESDATPLSPRKLMFWR